MKLDLICAKDELREALNYVKVTKEICVASDSHVLGVINTNLVFNKDFINLIPDRVYIHREDWKILITANYVKWESEKIIKLSFDKKRPKFIEIGPDSINYPAWESVVPQSFEEELNEISLNAYFLANLQKALDLPICDLSFSGQVKAIKVSHYSSDSWGIIMPCAKQQ